MLMNNWMQCLFYFSAEHRAPRHPSWTLGRKGGCGCRRWLWHLHGDSLREADRQLLLRCPGHPDRTEEVSWGLFLSFFHLRSLHLLSSVHPTHAAHKLVRRAEYVVPWGLRQIAFITTDYITRSTILSSVCLVISVFIFVAFLLSDMALDNQKLISTQA